ncbi:Gurmarin-like inhibitors Antifungal toxin protein [Rutstroemia sp. NJR-2017a WRK4]|nr:Gurmarin-like inhibitors Antifungal toxin protein [Rutstroemia sp. NJR-2017a WRK4]
MKFTQQLVAVALFIASTSAAAVPQADACLKSGVLCAGFAGPVGTCCKGYTCKYKFADYATCVPDKKPECLAEGATCESIIGSLGTCCTGKCTFVANDLSVCKSRGY